MDIEDIHLNKSYCYLTETYCKYKIGVNCFHPIYTYLLSKLNINQNNKIKNISFDNPYIYNSKQINKIINLIYQYDLFSYKLLNYSIYYFEYFINYTNIFLHHKNIFIIWFLSILICNKFIFDNPYSNQTYSLLFDLDLKTLNTLEILYINEIKFKLFHPNIRYYVKKITNDINIYHIQTICNTNIPPNTIKSKEFELKYH